MTNPNLVTEQLEQEEQQKMQQKVYLAEDIRQILSLGRSKTYELLEETYQTQTPFRVFKFGKIYRVPCNSFDSWLNGA